MASAFVGSGEPLGSQGQGAPYLNRELSWLDFDTRVMTLAADPQRPLLERVKFLAITARNLDEFFQIRVAGLKEQQAAGVGVATPDGQTPAQQLAAIRSAVLRISDRQYEIYAKELRPALAAAGIEILDWDALGGNDIAHLSRMFDEKIFPVLTPLSVDPAHPFPYISNLSLNLATVVRDPGSGERRFARVKVPPLFPRFLALPGGSAFVPIEQVIAAHLPALFPGVEPVAVAPFRVTRDAELEIEEDEADDLLEAIQHGLRRRQRSSSGVRLEVAPGMPAEVRTLLASELELDESDVYVSKGLLDYGSLWQLADLERPDLKDEPARAWTQPRLREVQRGSADPFQVLREGSILLHHPYDSFDTSVEAFLARSAADPDVLAIKHTIYRTSGADSSILRHLIRAAETGKQVVALLELKARFDEATNIEWARRLEEAGVHVVYGQVGLKTHAKIALVVRRERGGIRRYCHVGTGNYNLVTARSYEDVGILSADPELGRDLSHLFNHLTGYGRDHSYQKLLMAPATLRRALLELIRQEMELEDGRIVIKVNSLVDPEMIDALYAASQAGVQIDLIVRGICCLRPGVPGLSDRIRVRSIVGRFLEHSRIFRFGSEGRARRYFIGSADLMPRNLDRRLEVLVEVDEKELQARLDEILDINLADDALAWQLGPDATWSRVPRRQGLDAHARLLERARERAEETPIGRDQLAGA
jgi:polyphosphate kinase